MADTLFDLPAETVARKDLPPLKGTDKQIPWAEGIRTRLLFAVERYLTERRRLIDVNQQRGRDVSELRARFGAQLNRLAEMERETRAGWWIDHRECTADELLTGAPVPRGSRG